MSSTKSSTRLIAAILLTALIVSVVWYAVLPSLNPPRPAQKPLELKRFTVIFSWVVTGQWAPFYVALEKGYYAEKGLSPTFIPGRGSNFAITLVDQGKVDMAVIEETSFIIAVSKGAKLKAVMSYYDEGPAGVAALFPINKVKDLEGHSWGGTAFSAIRVLLPAAMRAGGADPNKLKEVIVDQSVEIPEFFKGDFDMTDGYIGSTMPTLESEAAKLGKPLYRASIKQLGLDVGAYPVIARTDFIEKNPDLIRGFIEATLKGIKDTMVNPDQATQTVLKFEPTLPRNLTLQELKGVVTILDQKGMIEPQRYVKLTTIMKQVYNVTNIPPPESLYTNEFVTPK